MKLTSYKDLIVWQRSMELVREVYQITAYFPRSEMFGLTSQMKRAAISIPSNIAEGSRRRTRKDFRQFLIIAFGSGSELETQIEIAKNLPFGALIEYQTIDKLLNEVMKMLNAFIRQLE